MLLFTNESGHFSFFKILFILFLDRGEGKEKEGEKHQCVVVFHVPPTGDLACDTGMCPDWESNRQPCGLQATPVFNPLSHTSQGERGYFSYSYLIQNTSHLECCVLYFINIIPQTSIIYKDELKLT